MFINQFSSPEERKKQTNCTTVIFYPFAKLDITRSLSFFVVLYMYRHLYSLALFLTIHKFRSQSTAVSILTSLFLNIEKQIHLLNSDVLHRYIKLIILFFVNIIYFIITHTVHNIITTTLLIWILALLATPIRALTSLAMLILSNQVDR